MSSMSAEKRLGLKLRALRKQRRLTQEEVAELSGFSIQHVGDIERGQANPTLACLVKLAEVMDLSLPELFTGEEVTEPDIAEMRLALIAFASSASKKQLAIMYALYRGLR